MLIISTSMFMSVFFFFISMPVSSPKAYLNVKRVYSLCIIYRKKLFYMT